MLYQKHRPNSLEEIKGNQELVSTLNSMLSNLDTFPHAVLITGDSGSGKTTLGRIIATRLGCVGGDFHEVDSADYRGIDSVREMRKNALYAPSEGPVRVWLLDEIHKFLNDSQTALLKILEDTPKHVYFILCTTEPQKLLPTLRGRCSTFTVKPLSDVDMYSLLKRISRAEGQKLTKEVLDQIVQDSQGHPRNAINVLEQVLAVDPEQQLAVASKSAEVQSQAIELCRALIGKKSWKEISNILNGLKEEEPEGIRRMVLGYAQAVLLKGGNNQAAAVMECFMDNFYDKGFPGLTFACYSSIS